jgi:hypothetical protein
LASILFATETHMSIITDIGKTVRSRIVGERSDAAKEQAKSEIAAKEPVDAEPTKGRLRQAEKRKSESDHKKKVGSTQHMDEPADRGASENLTLPGTKRKSETVLHLLRCPGGATIADMMAATSWQRHSVRGFLSGTVRKKLCLNLTSDTDEAGERRYRIPADTDDDGSAPADDRASGRALSLPAPTDSSSDAAVC